MIHILPDVIYVLLFKVESNYGSNVWCGVHLKRDFNQMNARVLQYEYFFPTFYII